MTLASATPAQIDAISAQSHVLWGAGLRPGQYRALWDDVSETAWAREHLRYRVWLGDDGTVRSSVKHYRPWARLYGRRVRITGIGALFTPREHRGRGHASRLLTAVLDDARHRGDALALLFTDIGLDFYRRLGFHTVSAEEASGVLARHRLDAPTGWSLRPMTAADLDRVARLHASAVSSQPFVIERDRDHWDYVWRRSECFFRRLDGSDLAGRFCIALDRDRFAGYLIAVDSGRVWVVREVAADGGDPDSMKAILQAGAAAARERGMRRVYGWFPRALARRIPEWRLDVRSRVRARPMIAPLDAPDVTARLIRHGAWSIPYLDQF